MSGADEAEKEHAPTQKRLDDARERGEAARSHDLAAAAGASAFVLAAFSVGPQMLQRMGDILMTPLAQADRMGPLWAASPAASFLGMAGAVAAAMLPLILPSAGAALACYAAQRVLFATPSNIAPKLNRISPLAGLKNRFGPKGLFEFVKNLGKLALATAILIFYLRAQADRIFATVHLTPAIATAEMLTLALGYLGIMAAVAVVFGAADYGFQRAQHVKGLRMSRQDLIDEQKSSEGDPHMKAQRRQRGQSIAMNTMLRDVPKADVVIVNPTHYAVALRWDRASGRPPVCVAKGVDEIAARIRESAAGAGVPVYRDAPTARTLHAALNVGEVIRVEHYEAVAAAIRFAEALRRRARVMG